MQKVRIWRRNCGQPVYSYDIHQHLGEAKEAELILLYNLFKIE
jgi:hypothetical protein